MDRQNEWRRRTIILPTELVERLYQWHGGQSSHVYGLASTGHENLVSLSMIDAALQELERDLPKVKNKADKKHLLTTLEELDAVRSYWREHSAKEAGLEDEDSGYDRRDYGLTAAQESKIKTKSG